MTEQIKPYVWRIACRKTHAVDGRGVSLCGKFSDVGNEPASGVQETAEIPTGGDCVRCHRLARRIDRRT